MKLLANENFPLTSVKILEKAGFDIIYIGQDFTGILDSEIIDLAIKEERTILDRENFYKVRCTTLQLANSAGCRNTNVSSSHKACSICVLSELRYWPYA